MVSCQGLLSYVAALLRRIEQGKIKDFTQTEAIDRVRRTHAHRMCRKIAKIKTKILPSEIEMPKVCSVHFSIKVHICTQVLTKLGAFSIASLFFMFHKEWQGFPHADLDCKNKHKNAKTSECGRESAHWQRL